MASRCKLALRHLLERRIARRFTRIATVSDAIRRYIETDIGIHGDRLLTVHNGIASGSSPATAARTQGAPITFITVGRLAEIKNHGMMLRAFRKLLDTRPQARLVIVGDGPARTGIEHAITAMNLTAQVTLTGFRTDTAALLAQADVFLLTSRYEGISIALLEAMRARLPALCTRVGGIPETVRDGESGLLVGLDDDAALADAMLRLADSPAERVRMGAAGYAWFMHEFSLDTMLHRYEQLYTGTPSLST
jgi:glycosyltransferase involved in cell wall biosynthesis